MMSWVWRGGRLGDLLQRDAMLAGFLIGKEAEPGILPVRLSTRQPVAGSAYG
jgi:hypothetical protein